MDKLSKNQKRHLRELSKIAYERDLAKCLEELFAKFENWRNKNISVWELDESVHEYHQSISKKLHERYSINNPLFTVALGISNGVISIEQVDESCKDRVQSLVEAINMND